MAYVMVDVESDGPNPGDYSMVCLGAVIVEPGLGRTFRAKLKPISERWEPDALKVSGFSREETLAFDDPHAAMLQFDAWLKENVRDRLLFIRPPRAETPPLQGGEEARLGSSTYRLTFSKVAQPSEMAKTWRWCRTRTKDRIASPSASRHVHRIFSSSGCVGLVSHASA
jgi:hypothetical protein